MADVFISYKRRLRPRILELADALEQLRLSVWFDAEIEPGKSFGAVINRELADARCVLVCWTPDAFAPEHGDDISWVEAEATKGRERKILVPVLLEKSLLNAPWNMLQTENLVDWTPAAPVTGAWLGTLAGIGKLVERPGLADYVRAAATGSAEELTRWAQAYPSDPLAGGVWERITELEIAAAKARVEANRTAPAPKPAPPRPAPAPATPTARATPQPTVAPTEDDPPPRPRPAVRKPWSGAPRAVLIAGVALFVLGFILLLGGMGVAPGYFSAAIGFILIAFAWLHKQRED